MDYDVFMKSIAGRAHAAVTEKKPEQLFLVLDSLKEHVERHTFDQGKDLTDVLRKYPSQEVDNLSFWVEEDHTKYVCRCENPYPFATELIIESDTASKDILVSVISAMTPLLHEAQDDEYFGFCTLFGTNGNRYRIGLETYTNAAAHLSVYHKTVPSHNQLAERKLDAIAANLSLIEVEFRTTRARIENLAEGIVDFQAKLGIR